MANGFNPLALPATDDNAAAPTTSNVFATTSTPDTAAALPLAATPTPRAFKGFFGPLTDDAYLQGILTMEGYRGTQDDQPGRGAKGLWQVRDDTFEKPGYGIKPGDPSVPGDRERVGRDYALAMKTTYGNNPALGAMAYNWGPGNLDKAIKTYGDPTKGEVSWDEFLSHAPLETQHYVRGIRGGGGPVVTPQTMATTATAAPVSQGGQQLQLPKPANPMDFQKMMSLSILQSLLPRAMAFHPVDYDPRRALKMPQIPEGPSTRFGMFGAGAKVGEGPAGSGTRPVTAYSPISIADLLQSGRARPPRTE